MRRKAKLRGFTLVELMIVVAVIAILVALALPSYGRYIRKANRGEAQQILLNWANNQEIWRANDTDYAQDTLLELKAPTHDKYDFSILNRTANTYTLRATASTTDQLKDKDRGVSCSPLNLDQSNFKDPPECW